VEITNKGLTRGGATTLKDSLVHSGVTAGVMVGGDQAALRLVGSTVGAATKENAIGVQLVGGKSLIGLLPQTTLLRRVVATPVLQDPSKKYDAATNPYRPDVFTLPASVSSLPQLYVGLGVGGQRIQPDEGLASAQIASISSPVNDRVTITISGGSINAQGNVSVLVDFGAFTTLEAGAKVIPLPTGVSPDELYLGQGISGTGIPAATTIEKISPDGTELTLSNRVTQTGVVGIGLTNSGRNTLSYNGRGIVLDGGTNRIVNTDINASTFDGIRVRGGTQSIGGNDRTGLGGRSFAKDISPASNAIYANGGAGIRVGASVPWSQVTIQGNRLGVTAGNVAGDNKQGNIVGFSTAIGTASEPMVLGSAVVEKAFVSSGVLGRAKVTLVDHGMVNGQVVYLDVNGVKKPFQVTVTSKDDFLIALDSAFSSVPVSATLPVKVYSYGWKVPLTGLTGANLANARDRQEQLKACAWRDFEGNLHAAATGPTSSSGGSGGIVPRPTIPGSTKK
jgi:hypothetical protein